VKSPSSLSKGAAHRDIPAGQIWTVRTQLDHCAFIGVGLVERAKSVERDRGAFASTASYRARSAVLSASTRSAKVWIASSEPRPSELAPSRTIVRSSSARATAHSCAARKIASFFFNTTPRSSVARKQSEPHQNISHCGKELRRSTYCLPQWPTCASLSPKSADRESPDSRPFSGPPELPRLWFRKGASWM